MKEIFTKARFEQSLDRGKLEENGEVLKQKL